MLKMSQNRNQMQSPGGVYKCLTFTKFSRAPIFKNASLQIYQVYSTLKRRRISRFQGRFHVVSRWNPSGVFAGFWFTAAKKYLKKPFRGALYNSCSNKFHKVY